MKLARQLLQTRALVEGEPRHFTAWEFPERPRLQQPGSGLSRPAILDSSRPPVRHTRRGRGWRTLIDALCRTQH